MIKFKFLSTNYHILSLLVGVTLFSSFHLDSALAAQKATVKGSYVNIRNGPGLSYSKITEAKQGTTFTVIKVNNGWYNLQLANKKNGWALGNLLTIKTVQEPKSTNANNNTGQTQSGKLVVTATKVNVRSGPGTNYGIITSLSKGSNLAFTSVKNNWYKVVLPNKKTGWVINTYVKTVNSGTPTTPPNPPKEESPQQPLTDKKLIVKASKVNVRSGPSINHAVVSSLTKGTSVTYIKESNNWYNVNLPNKKTGWVSGSYVEVVKNGNTDNPQEIPSGDPQENPAEEIKNIVLILVDSSAIRSTPDNTINENIITYGTKNETYQLLKTENGWHNIQLPNGQTGWIVETDGMVSEFEGDQGFQQIILPNDKKIVTYTADTYQNPYRLVVKVSNVHPNSSKAPDIKDNPYVSEVKVDIDPNNSKCVTFTYLLKSPIHYTVYTTPGEIKGTDGVIKETDTFDKKLTVKITSLTLKGKKIVIDAGHGGAYPDPRADSGAVARDSNGKLLFTEKQFNLTMALQVAKKLEEMGAEVILTRSTDVYIPLLERARIANQAEADIFISIHANSGPSTASGTETIKNTCVSTSKPFLRSQLELRNLLAQNVQTTLVKTIQTKDRRAYEDVRGLAVLKSTRMPSALIEVGFLSNSVELKKLMSPEFQDLSAKGIALGIEKYFTTAK